MASDSYKRVPCYRVSTASAVPLAYVSRAATSVVRRTCQCLSCCLPLCQGWAGAAIAWRPCPCLLGWHVVRRERCGQRLREIRIGLARIELEPLLGVNTQRLIHFAAADMLGDQPVNELRRGRRPGLLTGHLRLYRLIRHTELIAVRLDRRSQFWRRLDLGGDLARQRLWLGHLSEGDQAHVPHIPGLVLARRARAPDR